MAEKDRWERGLEKFKEVYKGDVVALPRGASDFFDLMMENLFCDVWTRPALCQRDRRLLMLGAIAALGERLDSRKITGTVVAFAGILTVFAGDLEPVEPVHFAQADIVLNIGDFFSDQIERLVEG